MCKATLILLWTAWIGAVVGCGGPKQEEYCEVQKLPCKSREQMEKDFTYWDGFGAVRSIDDGPRLQSTGGDGTGSCCYTVTYSPDGS
jgi:hypothetical protein